MKSNKKSIISASARMMGVLIILSTILVSLSSCVSVLRSLSYIECFEGDSELIEGEYPEELMDYLLHARITKFTAEPERDVFHTYDVSEDGKIALGYSQDAVWELFSMQQRIVVYSPENEFLYGVQLYFDGAFNLWWHGDLLNIRTVRGGVVISLDKNCHVVSIERFVDSEDNESFIKSLNSSKRTVGNTQYRAGYLGGAYSLLVSQENGNETVLHDATDQFILNSGLGAGCFIMFFLIAGLIIYLKSRK